MGKLRFDRLDLNSGLAALLPTFQGPGVSRIAHRRMQGIAAGLRGGSTRSNLALKDGKHLQTALGGGQQAGQEEGWVGTEAQRWGPGFQRTE